MAFTQMTNMSPPGYFSKSSYDYIRCKVKKILSHDFVDNVYVDDNSIARVLLRVLERRLETVDKMFNLAIMEICNEFKTYQLERVKTLRLERYYPQTQQIYNNLSSTGPDLQMIKLSKQPSTFRFFFA
uniref:Uncharacterized protein n=1 Tax=viral metagenome TaxID=1070528 RepID=A0A6C0JSG3_9ZZZZ